MFLRPFKKENSSINVNIQQKCPRQGLWSMKWTNITETVAPKQISVIPLSAL